MSLLLLHGWGCWGGWGSFGNWTPEKWGKYINIHDFWDEAYLPASPHWLYDWRTPTDIPFIYNYIDEKNIETPFYIGGFSDGAPLALEFARQHPHLISGVIFHSGKVDIDKLPATLPFRLLVIWGSKDFTAKIPIVGSNARELYKKYKGQDNIARLCHPGRHKWDNIANQVIVDWRDNV